MNFEFDFMQNVTKRIFLNTVACPTLGWILRNSANSDAATDLATQFRMEQGIEIGRHARNIFPQGILVDERDSDRAVLRTRELLSDPEAKVIYEGAFCFGAMIARADILVRVDNGWHLIEVKSSINDDEELVKDLAYTFMVCREAGLDVKKASLYLLSKDFRIGMPDSALCVEIDHTSDVFTCADAFLAISAQIDRLTGGSAMPQPETKLDCRKCDIFSECIGKGIENHIFEIPKLSEKKFNELTQAGILTIVDIPDGFDLTARQRTVRSSVKTHAPVIEGTFNDLVNSVHWPAYYLDFETVMTAFPLYPGIAPFTQIPTQYSIHKCTDFGKVESHFEYLADPARDCRRELAEKLIRDLGNRGSIVSYSSFEKTVLNGLKAQFPDLEPALSAIIQRLFDLEKIFREAFYHPDFHGRTSIKTTLPALVPGMSYDELEIGSGENAMAAFAFMAQGKYNQDEMEKMRANLLRYCEQDTMAMVRLHEKLHQLIVARN